MSLGTGRTMDHSDIETYFEDGQWKNKAQASERPSSSHGTKSDASRVGLEIARYRGVDHIIKNEDGTIGARNNYRSEPHPPKG